MSPTIKKEKKRDLYPYLIHIHQTTRKHVRSNVPNIWEDPPSTLGKPTSLIIIKVFTDATLRPCSRDLGLVCMSRLYGSIVNLHS